MEGREHSGVILKYVSSGDAAGAQAWEEAFKGGADPGSRFSKQEWKWQLTRPGMSVRPPRSMTRSSGRLSAGGASATLAMCSPSITTVASGRAG